MGEEVRDQGRKERVSPPYEYDFDDELRMGAQLLTPSSQ